jgi:hypothetical protein
MEALFSYVTEAIRKAKDGQTKQPLLILDSSISFKLRSNKNENPLRPSPTVLSNLNWRYSDWKATYRF